MLGVGTQWYKAKQEESRRKNDDRSVERKTAEKEGGKRRNYVDPSIHSVTM